MVYTDDLCDIYLLDLGKDNISIHVFVLPTVDRKTIVHYRTVLSELLVALKDKGLSVLKAWAQTDEQYRYAMFFGFKPTGNEVTILGYAGDPIYELEMELT